MNKKNIFSSILFLIILITSVIAYKFFLHNIIIKYLLFYFTIIGGGMFISIIFKKRIERTIPLNLLIMFALMYFFGLIGIMKAGVYIVIAVNYLLFIVSIFLILNKKADNKNLLTPGFVFWTLIFLVFSITTYKAGFVIWDEYTYWSMASKNMYYLDDFILNPNNTLNFTPYPPCPTILQYFFCKLVGQYSQGEELFLSIIFGFSLMLPLLKTIDKKNKFQSLLLYGVLIFIPAIFINSLFYKTIYVDTLLGLLFAYIVYEFFTEKKDKFLYIEIFLSVGVLSLTKATGLVFSLLFMILVGIYLIIKNKFKIKKIFCKKNILIIVLIFSSILLFYGSWTIYKESKPIIVNGQVYKDNSFSASGLVIRYLRAIKGNLMGGQYEYYNESLKNFSKDALDNQIYNAQPLPLSLITWIVLFSLVAVYIYTKCIKNSNEKERFKYYFISLLITTIIYILFVQMSYLDVFSISDALVHASIQRYIGSMLIAILYFLVGIFIINIGDNKNTKTLILFLIIIMFTPIAPITDITINSTIRNSIIQNDLSYNKIAAEKLIANVKDVRKVFMINQTRMKNTHLLRLRYFLTPEFISDVDVLGENNYPTSIHVSNVVELNKLLYDSYDYVYILEKDERLVDNFGAMFESEIKDWTLYKIVKNDSDKTVKLVEKEIN